MLHVLAAENQFMPHYSWGGFSFDSSRVRARSCTITLPLRSNQPPIPPSVTLPRLAVNQCVCFRNWNRDRNWRRLSPSAKQFGLNRWRRHNFSLCYISHCLLVIHAHTHIAHTDQTHTPTYTPVLYFCSCCCLLCFFGIGFCLCLVTFPLLLPRLQFTPHVLRPRFGAQFDGWSILISFFFCVCQLTVKTNDTEK